MNLIINPNNFPFFVTFVREIYDKFVEEIAKECQLKCLDEFYNPKVIHLKITLFWIIHNVKNDKEFLKMKHFVQTLVWEMNEFQFKDKTKSGSLKR
jgi:hypothetical protein